MKTSYLVASLVFAAACSDGGGKKMITPPVDAPMSTVDAPPACSAPATLTAATDLALFYNPDSQMMVTGNQEVWRTIGDLNTDAMPDWIWIELFEGPPPDYTTANFPATPFTVQLTGAETDYLKCSTCVSLTTDVNTANTMELEYLDDYMATAGSVTITTLTPTIAGTPATPAMITGTLDNVNFAHVDISMTGTVPNASGCTTSLTSLPFTAMAMPMAVNGQTGYRFAIGKNTGKRPIR
jgi:hypothetical protein